MAIKLIHGNSLEELKTLEDNSVDSIITDPPYEIGFMGKKWDNTGIAYNQELWEECLRVLKPGGHLLAFGATRSYHRMTVAIEDSGFEIRDCIMWLYGSGFPKSHNIALAIDKAEGAIGHRGKAINIKGAGNRKDLQGKEAQNQNSEFYHKPYNKPITKNGNNWNGWGTALKPAVEPVVMARKPFKGTVADNVLEHGTGAINIDECRIGTEKIITNGKGNKFVENAPHGQRTGETVLGVNIEHEGRFPANVILDEEAGAILDEQSGVSKSGFTVRRNKGISGGKNVKYNRPGPTNTQDVGYNDEGGASRFFYCPKANKTDRNEGCDELEEKMSGHSTADKCAKCGGGILKDLRTNAGCNCEEPERVGISSKNNHPTVKPTDLLAYLIRLVTPKGGVVLDPFMGSGSCGKAAIREGMSYIGIELEREYYEIAQARIKHEQDKHKNPWDKFAGNPDEENK